MNEEPEKHRELITFKKSDHEFWKMLQYLVLAKRASGMKTSFSAEIIRLAKNGMLNLNLGNELNRKILETYDDPSA